MRKSNAQQTVSKCLKGKKRGKNSVAQCALPQQKKPATGSQECTNLPQYLRILTSGIDVTKLDFLAPAGSTSSNGIKGSLYKFTCALGSTIQIGSDVYQLPDQIADVNPLSVEDVGITDERYTSSQEVKNTKLSHTVMNFISINIKPEKHFTWQKCKCHK